MKAKTINTLLVFSLTLLSCGNKENEKDNILNENQPLEVTVSNENTLVLDNGKKWIANSETTEGVAIMTQLMNSFESYEDEVSYNKLISDLQIEFKTIFEKCTMKGEAHNQLHHFLAPMKAMLEKLALGNTQENKLVFNEMNQHILMYKDYFE